MIKEKVKDAFKTEFHFVQNKFEVLDLLEKSPMESKAISNLKLPSDTNNIVWHPGVYVFIGNNSVYRVGVSMINSRKRVLDHLEAYTSNGTHSIWDINKYPDKSILLFNVINKSDNHWLLSLEAYLEKTFAPHIRSLRIG